MTDLNLYKESMSKEIFTNYLSRDKKRKIPNRQTKKETESFTHCDNIVMSGQGRFAFL